MKSMRVAWMISARKFTLNSPLYLSDLKYVKLTLPRFLQAIYIITIQQKNQVTGLFKQARATIIRLNNVHAQNK